MVVFREFSTANIISGSLRDPGDLSQTDPSVIAFPGFNLPPVCLYTNFTVRAGVTSDNDVYLGIVGGKAEQNNVVGTSFPTDIYACANEFSFTWTESSVRPSDPSALKFWTGEITKAAAASGYIVENFTTKQEPPKNVPVPDPSLYGLYRIGSIYDFNYEYDPVTGRDQAYVWICGTAHYEEMTGYQFPIAMKFYIQGMIHWYDYFPFAISKNNAWQSCNRDGGSFQMYSSGWQNKKNKYSETVAGSSVFAYNNGTWRRTDKIGAE